MDFLSKLFAGLAISMGCTVLCGMLTIDFEDLQVVLCRLCAVQVIAMTVVGIIWVVRL